MIFGEVTKDDVEKIIGTVFIMIDNYKGESPFEYGWEDFNSKKFYDWTIQRRWLTTMAQDDFMIDESSELFEIIEALNSQDEDYFGYKIFASYIVDEYETVEINKMLMRFSEG